MRIWFCIFILLNSLSLKSEDLPLWELGIGVGQLYVPDYPGSDEFTNFLLPFPYFIYRGPWLKADRDDGIRSLLFRTDKARVSFSFKGSFPIDSEDNETRRGMEDLSFIFELGPVWQYRFIQKEEERLRLNVPLRLVTSTNGQHTQERGLVWSPNLSGSKNFSCSIDCQYEWSVGFSGASKKLHNYFYEVGPEDVLPTRSLYGAKAGTISWYLQYRLRFEYGKHFLGGSITYSNYEQNANTQSPLFKRTDSYSIGIVWFTTFWESETKESTDSSLVEEINSPLKN
ncbi:MAG: MipA/OmpV family protein [Bdellovibrionales bacterium]